MAVPVSQIHLGDLELPVGIPCDLPALVAVDYRNLGLWFYDNLDQKN